MATPRKPAPRRVTHAPKRALKKLYRRWQSKRHVISDTLWSNTWRASRYVRALSKPDRERLRELAVQFLDVKSFEGASGLVISDAMRVRIALHACLPILNLGLEYYADWVSIVIYPGDFRVHDEFMDEHGIVHQEIVDLCGQSLTQGPIVLSWETIRKEDETPADHDLVIHECAHKLDILNGDANGFPPLHVNMKASEWAHDFHAAYNRLCAKLESGIDTHVDPYAADDPSEFFAVMSETFFTAPHLLYNAFPSVYKQLQRFYRQDPYRLMQNLPP